MSFDQLATGVKYVFNFDDIYLKSNLNYRQMFQKSKSAKRRKMIEFKQSNYLQIR